MNTAVDSLRSNFFILGVEGLKQSPHHAYIIANTVNQSPHHAFVITNIVKQSYRHCVRHCEHRKAILSILYPS